MPDLTLHAQYNVKSDKADGFKQPVVQLRPIIRQGNNRPPRLAYMISASEALLNPGQRYHEKCLTPEQLNVMRQFSNQVFIIEKSQIGKLEIERVTKPVRENLRYDRKW